MGKINQINEILTHFCSEIIREPLLYFSEADLQALLYNYLIKHFNEYVKTGYHKGHNSKNVYKTRLVHREYGINGMKNSRVDLVLFSEEEVGNINNSNLTIDDKYVTPFAAFELGTEKSIDFTQHINNDLMKLKELVNQGMKRGYYIHFFRDTTLSASNTSSREKTEEKINKQLKIVAKNVNNNQDINLLLFLIRIHRKNQCKIWGKCEIFNVKNQEWEKVAIDHNTKKLEKMIRSILK